MRKIAREAVIFMLLGPVVVVIVAFVFLEIQSITRPEERECTCPCAALCLVQRWPVKESFHWHGPYQGRI